ncbi:MAG: peptide chain release factor N(5)-glutamine methyltransferase [Methylacidiphilales bacterium]|nr:peptide chain release factor N(5)-glutamine methyltransferase [Candidatus Methylacidiphilales bacterium]
MTNSQFPNLISGEELWLWRNAAIAGAIAHNIEAREVDWLLREIAGLDSLVLRLELYKEQPKIEMSLSLKDLDVLWQRRLHERLPVQYIAGIANWRQFQLQVTPAVLIPRQETELLIDLALAATDNHKSLRNGNWADLGTGSGAISIGLADIFHNATIHAVDFSIEALEIAQRNAENLSFASRIKFYQGSWWEPLASLKGKFSGMISNPPYIPSDTVLTLDPEVANHEPHLALDGGIDGLDFIRHLIQVSPEYLQSGGVWLIEMMVGQAEIVCELLETNGNYRDIQIHQDLAGIERFAIAFIK